MQYNVDEDKLGQKWPVEHKGPINDMLARCPSSGCESVDKTTLEFFKIAEAGLIDDSNVSEGGNWATDILREQDGWLITVPSQIAPGFYVLRHEIIALHNAPYTDGGAQNYPFCFNLEVTGSGTETPKGASPTTFYTTADPGIDISIWNPISKYVIPGPALMEGVEPVTQKVLQATSEGTIQTGGGSYEDGETSGDDQVTTRPSATKTAIAPVASSDDGEEEDSNDYKEDDGDSSINDDDSNEHSNDDDDDYNQGDSSNDDDDDVAVPVKHTTRFVTVTMTRDRAATSSTRVRGHRGGHRGGVADVATEPTAVAETEKANCDGREEKKRMVARRHARRVGHAKRH